MSAADTDPVLTLAGVLSVVDALASKMDRRGVAAYGTKERESPDHLGNSVNILSRATWAIRNAISYLPAVSPAGAVIQVALAGIAADCARGDTRKKGMFKDIEQAERHIEAALPVLAKTLGVDLKAWGVSGHAVMLPDVLREAYIADVIGISPPIDATTAQTEVRP